MICHLVVQPDSHIYQAFPEEDYIAKSYVLNRFSWHVIIMNMYILLQWVFVLFNVTYTSSIYEEATVSICCQYLWYKMQNKGINV